MYISKLEKRHNKLIELVKIWMVKNETTELLVAAQD